MKDHNPIVPDEDLSQSPVRFAVLKLFGVGKLGAMF